MGPVGHTIISTGIGAAIWAITESPAAGGIALGVGVLVDIDHVIDFYQWWIRCRPNKLFILFHGWEYSLIGILVLVSVYYHPILLAVTVSHLGHVATDHIHNRLVPLGYFILYRVWVRFDAVKIAPEINIQNSYRSLPNIIPLGQLWEPWYRRRVEPWIASRVGRTRGEAETKD